MNNGTVDGIGVALTIGVIMLGIVLAVAVYGSYNTACTVTVQGAQINGAYYKTSGMQFGDRETATIDKLTFENKGEYCGELIRNVRVEIEQADRND